MKKLIKFSWAHSLIGVALFAGLASFSSLPGSHSFQVYLDDKLVIDQYVNSRLDAPKLVLDPAENHRQLTVKYNECGRTATGRILSLKDSNNKVLKEWRFDGESKGYSGAMTCSIKEITALFQKESNPLKLYYSSKDFAQGQLVASVLRGGELKSSLK